MYRAQINTVKQENKNEINNWFWNKKIVSGTSIIGPHLFKWNINLEM